MDEQVHKIIKALDLGCQFLDFSPPPAQKVTTDGMRDSYQTNTSGMTADRGGVGSKREFNQQASDAAQPGVKTLYEDPFLHEDQVKMNAE